MGTSINRVPVNDTAYVNASNGNLHATLVVLTGQVLRLVVADSQPAVDTLDFIAVFGPENPIPYRTAKRLISVTDLEAGDDLWVRTESGSTEVTLMRGAAKLIFTG